MFTKAKAPSGLSELKLASTEFAGPKNSQTVPEAFFYKFLP